MAARTQPERAPHRAQPAGWRRSKALIIQNRDGSLVKEPLRPHQATSLDPSYRVELPLALLDEHSSVIDRIIAFAFDTLGARHIDVRVREAE